MLQLRSMLNVADNSGAKIVSMIGMAKGNRKFAYLGEVINVTVKQAQPFGMVNKVKSTVRLLLEQERSKKKRR